MKYLSILLIALLTSCSGSETYRGKWKATNIDGIKMEITFQEKNFTIKSANDYKDYSYTQNSINITNGVKTYGVRLGDGRSYHIHFPISQDESIGFIKDEMGNVLYTISRHSYLNQNEVYALD